MKLVKQSRLQYQDQTSDKVYEVDLCEVGTNQYLVNFRYGKRGGNLKDGTKTSSPVNLTEATKIFDKLVTSKTKKGYQPEGQAAASPTPKPIVKLEMPNVEGAAKNIVSRLKQAAEQADGHGGSPAAKAISIWGSIKKIIKETTGYAKANPTGYQWPLTRIVWRAGELKIKEATPFLLKLPIGKNLIEQYSLIWALGKCGDASIISHLDDLIKQKKVLKPAKALAREVKRSLLNDADCLKWSKKLLATLPADYQEAIKEKDNIKLLTALEKTVKKQKTASDEIATLYLLDESSTVRQSLRAWIKKAPMKGGGHFQGIRQLFKAAEFRVDGEMYGLIAHKVFTNNAGYSVDYWRDYVYVEENGRWINVNVKKELASPKSRIGFSEKTKTYFEKRSWRTLRKKAEQGDLDYIKMAVGILSMYTDKDKKNIPPYTHYTSERVNGRWQYTNHVLHYTDYSPYDTFNQILYKNSPRYKSNTSRTAWVLKTDVKKGDTTDQREEAYPELWDKVPQGTLHLLATSNCTPVQEFAVRTAKANMDNLMPYIDEDFICILLKKPYNDTALLGLDLARQKYLSGKPSAKLILALINSIIPEASQLGLELLDKQQDLLKDTSLVISCLFTPHKELSKVFGNILTAHTFSEEQSKDIVAVASAKLLAYSSNASDQDKAIITNASNYLVAHFQDQLSKSSFTTIQNFLDHPLPEVKVFGAKLLLSDTIDKTTIPEPLILGLINGESPEMREVGIELLGKLPNEKLIEKRELLKGLCLSPHSEVRKNAHPIVANLAKKDKIFGQTFTNEIVMFLLRTEDSEDRDQDIRALLENHLGEFVKELPLRKILQLIHSPRKAANQMGYELLNTHKTHEDLKMRQIVRLANHEMYPIRQWCWNVYKNQPARIKYESSEAVRLVDAKWDDSRDFAFDYFRKNFAQEDWTPEILVSICDSVNPLVQQFGKELITNFFEEKNGEQYLLQLSQHPTADLQQFATNYLDRFATDSPEKIKELELYFITVLSGVNKSSVAKERIFNFLRKEALKNEDTAKVVAGILTRQSAMMVIRDKAQCIKIMRDLQQVYPDLPMSAKLKDIETYPV